MKAKVYFKEFGKRGTTKTIEVENKEPCSIIREFVKETGVTKSTYISHVKCGRTDYQWNDTC